MEMLKQLRDWWRGDSNDRIGRAFTNLMNEMPDGYRVIVFAGESVNASLTRPKFTADVPANEGYVLAAVKNDVGETEWSFPFDQGASPASVSLPTPPAS